MARDTTSRTGRVQVQDAANRFGYSVVAQSPQQAAANASGGGLASGLSKALGIGGKVAQARFDHQRDQAAMRAEQDVAQGLITDDNVGELDEKTAYGYHAMKVLNTAAGNREARAMREWYLNEFPKDGTPEELDAELRKRYAKSFGGMDPQMAQFVLPAMDKAREDILTGHSRQITEDIQSSVVDAQMENFKSVILDPESNIDSFRKSANATLGKDAANELMAATLVQTINETNDPYLANRFEKLRTNPKFSGAIEKAVKEAQTFQDGELIRHSTAQAANLVDNGRLTDSDAAEMVKLGVWSQEEAGNQLATSWNKGVDAVTIEQAGDLALGGSLYGVEKKYRQGGLKDAISRYPADQQGAAAIQLGIANGEMLDTHKSLLKMATLDNPQNFDKAFALFNEYNARDPRFAAANVPEPQQYAFEAYRVLTQDMGVDPKNVNEIIKGLDHEAGRNAVANVDFYKMLGTAMENVQDIPWSMSDVRATPQLQTQIRKVAETYLAMGYFTPETAFELAAHHVGRNRVDIDGSLFHVSQGWHSNAEGQADFMKTSLLPEGEDPSDWTIRPDFETKSTGDVVLVRNGELPFGAGVIRADIREYAGLYDAKLRGESLDDVLNKRADARRTAEAQATFWQNIQNVIPSR